MCHSNCANKISFWIKIWCACSASAPPLTLSLHWYGFVPWGLSSHALVLSSPIPPSLLSKLWLCLQWASVRIGLQIPSLLTQFLQSPNIFFDYVFHVQNHSNHWDTLTKFYSGFFMNTLLYKLLNLLPVPCPPSKRAQAMWKSYIL